VAESPRTQPDYASIFRTFRTVADHAVGFTLICYVLGFVVTNLYLGTLGLVNFDVLRVRYILTGLLFAVFVATIAVPLHSLFYSLARKVDRSRRALVSEAVTVSMEVYGFVFLSGVVLASLAGRAADAPPGVPELSPHLTWQSLYSGFFRTFFNPLNILFFTIGFAIIVAISLTVLGRGVTDVSDIADKGGFKFEHYRNIGRWAAKPRNWPRLVGAVLTAILALFLWNSLVNLLVLSGIYTRPFSWTLPRGWWRFIGYAFLIYVCAGGLLLWAVTRQWPPFTTGEPSGESKATRMGTLVPGTTFTLALVGCLVVLFAVGIYPHLPQQVGGGSPIRIELMTKDDSLNRLVGGPDTQIYLLDRTSAATLIMVVNSKNKTWRIVEVTNTQVDGIAYLPPP
jgi:hypothetical protein